MTLDGPEDKALWFMFRLEDMMQVRWKFGTDMGNGEIRYCNMANGGPLAVYVKDGKIVSDDPDLIRCQGSAALDHRSARQDIHAAPQDFTGASWPEREIHGLFA